VIVFFFFLRDSQVINEDSSAKTIVVAGHISEAHQRIIDSFNKKQKGKTK
jgi:hypothetical protein